METRTFLDDNRYSYSSLYRFPRDSSLLPPSSLLLYLILSFSMFLLLSSPPPSLSCPEHTMYLSLFVYVQNCPKDVQTVRVRKEGLVGISPTDSSGYISEYRLPSGTQVLKDSST